MTTTLRAFIAARPTSIEELRDLLDGVAGQPLAAAAMRVKPRRLAASRTAWSSRARSPAWPSVPDLGGFG